jgi:hypothetical protein
MGEGKEEARWTRADRPIVTSLRRRRRVGSGLAGQNRYASGATYTRTGASRRSPRHLTLTADARRVVAFLSTAFTNTSRTLKVSLPLSESQARA